MELLVRAAMDVAISPVDTLFVFGLPLLITVGIIAVIAVRLIVKVFRRKGEKNEANRNDAPKHQQR